MKRLSIGIIVTIALVAGCAKPGMEDTSAADGAANVDRAKVTSSALSSGDGSSTMTPEETQALMKQVVANIPSDGQPPVELQSFSETDHSGRGIHGSSDRGFFAAGYAWAYPYPVAGGVFNGPYRTGYAACAGGACSYGLYNKYTGATYYGTCTRWYCY